MDWQWGQTIGARVKTRAEYLRWLDFVFVASDTVWIRNFS
jgi:hypothetical protein